jgi:hypothetical protein
MFPPKFVPLDLDQEFELFKFKQKATSMLHIDLIKSILINVTQMHNFRNLIENKNKISMEQQLHIKGIELYYKTYPKDILIGCAYYYMKQKMLFQNMLSKQKTTNENNNII